LGIEKVLWEIPLCVAYQLVSVNLWKNGARLRRPLLSKASQEIEEIEKLLGI